MRFTVPPSPGAVAEARLVATRAAADRVSPEVVETLRLLVSEVVTNSVRHSATKEPIELELVFEDELRVEVTDHGDGFTAAPHAVGPDQEGGFGLYLVAQLAERWGVVRNHVTRVWFALAA